VVVVVVVVVGGTVVVVLVVVVVAPTSAQSRLPEMTPECVCVRFVFGHVTFSDVPVGEVPGDPSSVAELG
jgi:hypothetical protein